VEETVLGGRRAGLVWCPGLVLLLSMLVLAFNVQDVLAVDSWVWVRDTVTGAYGEAVVGTGTVLYIARGTKFYRFLPADNIWAEMTDPPNPDAGDAFKTGTALAWDFGDHIYALYGAATDDSRRWFYRYSISQNSWQALANTTVEQGEGDAITWVGIDNCIYATIGGEQRPTYLMRYDPSTNSWSDTPADPPAGMGDGASLVWTGGDYLYALRGEFLEESPLYDFWCYSLSENAWVAMADIPADPHDGGVGGVGDGGSLLYVGLWLSSHADYIYALSGNQAYPENPSIPDNRTYRYTISMNSWERLVDLPFGVGHYVGCRLGYADGHIYAWQGAPSTWAGGGDDLARYRLAWTVDDDGPADFHTIQEAINAASPGDTIYVRTGTYYESVTIRTDNLTVTGERKENTIIDGEGKEYTVVLYDAEHVNFSGFTIRNARQYDVYLYSPSGYSWGNNHIKSNKVGTIVLSWLSISNKIEENTINKGIFIPAGCDRNIIRGNDITGYIHLRGANDCTIEYNNIIDSEIGIYLYAEVEGYACGNTIRYNNLISNTQGISGYTWKSYGNVVQENNFINNGVNVALGETSSGYAFHHNFWSDYHGIDLDGDGIGDTPYVIDASNQDTYPLIVPVVWNYSTPVPIVWEGTAYWVSLSSNSTISTFKFNQPQMQISFNVTGPSGKVGYCNVTIPKTLLSANPWIILIDGVPITDYTQTENETHTTLYFTYTHSTKTVTIIGTNVVPEFPSVTILPTLLAFTTLAIILAKRKTQRKLKPEAK